jgi:hypothetical protein
MVNMVVVDAPLYKTQQWKSCPDKIALLLFLHSLPPHELISSPLKPSLSKYVKKLITS